MYICGVYVCSVRVPAGNASSALLLFGPRDMEQQQQPRLSQAVVSSMIYFPLTLSITVSSLEHPRPKREAFSFKNEHAV